MKRMMSRVVLFVDDIKKMTEFYGNVIGLGEFLSDSDDFVIFQADGVDLCLHKIPTEYVDGSSSYQPREDSYIKLVFYSETPENERKILLEKGVKMKEPVYFKELVLCDGFDPEGNVFQISNR